MKKSLHAAMLLAALVSLGMNEPAGAAGGAGKSARPAAKKALAKVAAKPHRPSPRAAKTARAKPAHSALHAPAHLATHPAGYTVASVKKAAHKVSAPNWEPGEAGKLALYSSSALVIDQTTGKPVFQKNPDAVVPIASISKLMTAMVVLDAQLDMQDVISIGEEDVDALKGTRSRLQVGTTMTRQTAMLLALMSSENRAANALGRHYPGGLPAFVAAMNQKARSLGMIHSRFEEPTGLSSNNVSTAEDLARMVAAASEYSAIREFSTTADAKVEVHGRIQEFRNTNALVKSERWEIGVSKTGYISEAGRCLVMQAKVADKPVVIVLLDSNGKMTRVGDANRIKRWMESTGSAHERKSV